MVEKSIHHINGNHSDNRVFNLITLCPECHDLVQGICDKCLTQPDCSIKKLQLCWAFDDSLPPIYFKSKDSLSDTTSIDVLKEDKPSQNRRKGANKPTFPCRCILYLKEDKLIQTCLLRKIKDRVEYPCKNSRPDGCIKFGEIIARGHVGAKQEKPTSVEASGG